MNENIIINFDSIFNSVVSEKEFIVDKKVKEKLKSEIKDKLETIENLLMKLSTNPETDKINTIHIRTLIALQGYKICY